MFPQKLTPSFHFLLPFIILVEGFVSISAEILTIRQLLPVAGGSVIVTSLIIGIFLLFLALGYQQGGHYLTNAQKNLCRNFLMAAFWLGIGLSYPFVYFFFTQTEKFVGSHIIYPLVGYLLLVIAPLIYILGQTLPITMNIVKQDKDAGVIGGKTLFLSTVGSFLGAILTSLVTLHFFGVGWALFSNVVLLLCMVLYLSYDQTRWWKELFLSAFCMSAAFVLNVEMEKLTFLKTTNYANYFILSEKNSSLNADERILVINEGLSSYTNKEKKGFRYIELIKKILFHDLKLRGEKILVLGAGGFSLSAEDSFGNFFTYVDIDADIKTVTVPQFRSTIQDELIIDDARHYLQSLQNTYAAIITDVYNDIKTIPAHLLTREYMLAIKAKLAPNGYALFNIIANPMLTDAYSRRIDNTIRSVFPACMAIPIQYADQATNIIYACKNLASHDKTVYTDNLNNSTTDSFFW